MLCGNNYNIIIELRFIIFVQFDVL